MASARLTVTRAGRVAAGVAVLTASMVGLPAGAAVSVVEEVPTCMGEPATIVGEPGRDVEGTDGPDVIVGGSGTQRISPGGGRDLVCAGDGHDGVFDRDHALDRINLGDLSDLFTSETADPERWWMRARARTTSGTSATPSRSTSPRAPTHAAVGW
jgi:hypothetical protein